MPQTLRTHVFTDLRGYSRLVEDRGDDVAKLMVAYTRIVRRALPSKVGLDRAGDTFHMVFPAPAQAVRTAIDIADALQRHNDRHGDMRIPVSFGIDAGQSVRQGRNYVGSAPVTASRLCALAQPGQILVSETVFALLRTAKTQPLRDLGVWKLKGRGEAVHVYEARPPDPRPDGSRETERLLRTLFFTDIVQSTAAAASIGDERWRGVVERHHAIVREELHHHGGTEIDTAGDGFYAAFDAPSRAIGCAFAVRDRVRDLGIDVRVGIHAGEVEVVAGKIGGMAVAVGARVKDQAGPAEVLVSQTIRDLVVGAGFAFTDRGRVVLKGVPGEWPLYAIAPGTSRPR